MARRVQLPIGVHSIGFPKSMNDFEIQLWLADHGFEAARRIIRGGKGSKYAWARLRNVSRLHEYRTKHWDTSVGRVAVRFAIHKRRVGERTVEREIAAVRRRVA